MPVPKMLLVGLGVLTVAAGGVAGAVLVGGDDDEGAAPPTTTSTTVATTTSPPTEPSTTTTAAPARGSTTSTAAARTTTTRAATSTASTTRAPTTSVTSVACGTGTATVAFAAKDLQTDTQSSTFVPQAVVDNQVNLPIEVEALVIDVLYPDNVVRTVTFPTAGTVIAAGTRATFDGERLTTTKRYEGARITRFTYFTAGRRDACRVSAP